MNADDAYALVNRLSIVSRKPLIPASILINEFSSEEQAVIIRFVERSEERQAKSALSLSPALQQLIDDLYGVA